MIFLSQRPNNDPQPYEIPNTYDALTGEGNVRLSEKADGAVLAPRPEFTQTRDPLPWECAIWLGCRHPNKFDGSTAGWSPRHEEFDLPVNPILAYARRSQRPYFAALYAIRSGQFDHYPIEARDHAYRVLALLLVISE